MQLDVDHDKPLHRSTRITTSHQPPPPPPPQSWHPVPPTPGSPERALRVRIAPVDALYTHDVVVRIMSLIDNLRLPSGLDPLAVGRLMTMRETVEERLSVTKFKETHSLVRECDIIDYYT